MKKSLILLSLTTTLLSAQTYQQQQAKLVFYNVLFNGVGAGIGAGINKHDNQTFFQAFGQGFYKGCIGGAISYTGKRMNYLIVKHENLWYGWPAKIVHSFGSSISENAGYNRRMLEVMSLEFGPGRFEYLTYENRVRAKVMPISLVMIGYLYIAKNNLKFELKNSIKLGNLMFSSTNINSKYTGQTGCNIIWINNYYKDNYQTISHENVHSFQNKDFNICNSFNKIQSIFYKKNISKYIYIQLPLNTFFLFKNSLEFEAYLIADRIF